MIVNSIQSYLNRMLNGNRDTTDEMSDFIGPIVIELSK